MQRGPGPEILTPLVGRERGNSCRSWTPFDWRWTDIGKGFNKFEALLPIVPISSSTFFAAIFFLSLVHDGGCKTASFVQRQGPTDRVAHGVETELDCPKASSPNYFRPLLLHPFCFPSSWCMPQRSHTFCKLSFSDQVTLLNHCLRTKIVEVSAIEYANYTGLIELYLQAHCCQFQLPVEINIFAGERTSFHPLLSSFTFHCFHSL